MPAAAGALLRRRAAAPPFLALLQPLLPWRGSTPRSPLLAAPAARIPAVCRTQLSPPSATLPLLRYYWSKPSMGCTPPPQRQTPTSGKEMPRLELEEDEEFLIGGLQEDLEKHTGNLVEALFVCKKAIALLYEGWDNKTVAMFENGLERAFEALADREKALDDVSRALGSSNALSKDTLQKLQMIHDKNKFARQELNNVRALFVATKMENKIKEVDLGQKKPNELSTFKGTAVALRMCFVLAMMINVIFLHSIRI